MASPKTRINRKWLAAGFGGLLAAGLGLFLHSYALGSGLIRASYDLLHVARGEIATSDTVLVYLDEKSYLQLGQAQNKPWDRGLHARLIDRLTAAGAKAIVFDVVFSDPNPESAAADQRLADAIKASGRVVLAADNVPYQERGQLMHKIVPPFPLVRQFAAGIGSDELRVESDDIAREHTPEDQIPALSWAAAELVKAKVTQQEGQTVQRWINYYGHPNLLPWRSYVDALNPALVGDEFSRGKVVFVGARILTKNAYDRKDEYRNPFSYWAGKHADAMFMAGAEIQATACLNLLRSDWLTRLAFLNERALILLAGLLFGFGLIWFRPLIATAVTGAGLMLVAGLSYLLFVRGHIWFPWLIIIVEGIAGLSWSVVFNSVQLYVEKRMYEQTLAFYLSPKLVKRFARDRSFQKPGAEEQTLTIFFSDIADFTSITGKMDPDTLVKLMNTYFQMAVSECIHQTDGTVVKYIGDAIFAFWNAPELQADHAFRACEAALRFRDLGTRKIDGRRLRTRMGIHTGIARVGNFGSYDRFDYTALGDNVNLASRLEGLNKYLGTDCLVTAETHVCLGDRLVTRPVGLFQLKGFDKDVEVFELIGWPDQAESTRPWREAFAQALNNYKERNMEFAEAGFRTTLELRPGDGPSEFYLGEIEKLRGQTVPDEWHTILREK